MSDEKRVEGEAEEVMISPKELKKAKRYAKKKKPKNNGGK